MRNDRKRHARPGEEIQHYTGMRTKHCRKIGTSRCTAVTPVRLNFRRDRVEIAGAPHIITPAGLDDFARRDGFRDWSSLVLFWHDEHEAIREWSGVLIEWEDFKPA